LCRCCGRERVAPVGAGAPAAHACAVVWWRPPGRPQRDFRDTRTVREDERG